jgi:hypothetical protein
VVFVGVLLSSVVVEVAVPSAGNAQATNKVCQVEGVTSSNGFVCTKVGTKLVWRQQNPQSSAPTGASSTTAPKSGSAQLPDPCGVVDTAALAQLLGQPVSLSRPQETKQLRTCGIVNSNGFRAGSFVIRNDIDPFLIGRAFIDDPLWLWAADFDPLNCTQVTSPNGKTVFTKRTYQYQVPVWWLNGNGYRYGVVVQAKLSADEEQRIVANIGR